ncbi:uncharacterized protein YALI1_B23515g [Yarrowia lipolytica]|uniref:Uncharacterized protein n=1 Tax=Yarrowia lipolytica TaxID=4952 RepID=A0A1D8N8D6_YARLL|nr:hypothetical protein YALI1_B23515g [Yarrowia lipolytica]
MPNSGYFHVSSGNLLIYVHKDARTFWTSPSTQRAEAPAVVDSLHTGCRCTKSPAECIREHLRSVKQICVTMHGISRCGSAFPGVDSFS